MEGLWLEKLPLALTLSLAWLTLLPVAMDCHLVFVGPGESETLIPGSKAFGLRWVVSVSGFRPTLSSDPREESLGFTWGWVEGIRHSLYNFLSPHCCGNEGTSRGHCMRGKANGPVWCEGCQDRKVFPNSA